MQSPNNNVQIALIGAGGMGSGDARMSSSLPGVKLVAVCDIYDGRLQRAREVWGNQIFTTRDHREILSRKDIDAVIVATPDHWHARITTDALNAGKDVYCEKPMVQKIEEGKPVIEAQKKSGRIVQIGSQYASSVVFRKAADLLKQGAIGELNMVQAHLDRNTALGAWQYSIPPDASPQNVDWDRFLGHAPKRPFEPVRLFRWRNYKDYGTGVAGDLYVHLLTGLHVVTGSKGPRSIYAAGGTRFWNDGRDAPDVMLATMDYPGFTLALRVNFASGGVIESFGIRFVGSEGIMEVDMDTVKLAKTPREPEYDYTIGGFPQKMQGQLAADFNKRTSQPVTPDSLQGASESVFRAPRWFSAHREHHRNFIHGVRTRKAFFEDAVFGFRTAGPLAADEYQHGAGPHLQVGRRGDGRVLMLAVHLEGGQVEVRKAPRPRRAAGFATIRLIFGGICNTDLELQRGYYGYRGTPGHEFVGEVVEADTAALVGKRVVGEINLNCGKCDWCKRGLGRHCPKRAVLGIVKHPGAFRELLTLPERNLHIVPKGIASEHAVFVEPIGAACEILDQVKIPKKAAVAVLGDGKLGLLVSQVLQASGARVHQFGRHAHKLAIAERAGVTGEIMSGKLPVAEYDWVVDATGSAEGLKQAVSMTRPRGTVIMKSTVHGEVPIDTAPAIVNEITLVGSRCGRFEPALKLLAAKKIHVDDMIMDSIRLDYAPLAFERAAQHGVLKVLLHP